MADRQPVRTEGRVAVPGGSVWYESAGEGPHTLLLLHGGPGASSDYLIPLLDLAGDGWRVVRYDQLGSRRSDKPDDPSLWRVDRFVAEVDAVRAALGLERMHLLGQSWGAFLALEYALAHPQRLQSLTIASGAASTRECLASMNRCREGLPAETQAMMARHEAAGTHDDPEYLAAIDELYRRHLCRTDPWPEVMQVSMANMALPVYESMWGPNEFTCTGTLLEWDVTPRLGEIGVPTLVTVGRFDEIDPSCAETIHRGIPGSELAVFEESSHSAHLEEPERYMETLRGFLARHRTEVTA